MCSNWGWGSLPQLLSWHRTTLIATRAKAPSIIHRGCEWLGWDIRNICHPTTEDYFLNIALLHPNLFLLKEEGDCGTKTSHLGEILTPLRDRILSSKSSKREGLTSLYASAQPQWTHVNSLNPELQAVPGRADFLLFLSLSLTFLLTRNSVWTSKAFPMEFPQKASVLMNKHSSQGEEKVFYWRILDQSPLLVLQQGPHFKITLKKKTQTHLSQFFFLFNSQLSSQWGISAAQNKGEQRGYLVPSSYWPPVPTQTWGLSVFVPQFSFRWEKVFACLPGDLNSDRVNFSCAFTLLWQRTRALN